MSYPNVLFVTQLESLETRRNISRSFFQDICKPTSCLHHLILPPRDTSVTTRLRHHFLAKTQFMHEKVLFIRKLWPTPLPTNIVTPNRLHISPSTYVHYMHIALFRLLFYRPVRAPGL